jgi:uncharacterized iron-regulated membrane protein
VSAQQDLATAFSTLESIGKTVPIGAIELSPMPDGNRVVFIDGPERVTIMVGANGGQLMPDPRKQDGINWHFILQDLHAGYFMGQTGRVISALLGLSLTFFSLSGLWMYYDMFRRRAKQNRKNLFW